MTLSIMIFHIMKLSLKNLFVTLRITDTQQNCQSAITLNVVLLSVFLLSVVVPDTTDTNYIKFEQSGKPKFHLAWNKITETSGSCIIKLFIALINYVVQ